eukprot:4112907-Prorocentrum_lima.AAC.1
MQTFFGPGSLLTKLASKNYVTSSQLPFRTPWWKPVCYLGTSAPARGDISCHIMSTVREGSMRN